MVEAPDIVAAIFNGITTMQDMTPEICAAAKEGDTVRLRDARDDKMYWVAKLADGQLLDDAKPRLRLKHRWNADARKF